MAGGQPSLSPQQAARLRPLDARRRARLCWSALQAATRPGSRGGALARSFATVALDRFDASARAVFAAIEARRVALRGLDDPLVIDLTSEVPDLRIETTIGAWGTAAAIDPPRGRLLYALARELRPSRCLELGTNMGISSAYIAAGLGDGARLISIDMVPEATAGAREHHAALALERAEFRTGLFSDVMPDAIGDLGGCDFAFVDGDHREEPTLAYFEQIAAVAPAGAVIALDNIAGSDEMERAWRRVRAHPRTALAVDFEALGLAVLRQAP